MLEVHDVSVRFGDVAVLDDVSISVERSDVVALLGPSGSGKSTLLRVIAGIVAPDAGRVVIDGVDVSAVPTHQRSVGMEFQDEQLFPHLDVGANVAFGLRMAGVGKAERRARVGALLHLVGLDGFGGRAVDRLSGGEAKRVALARSLAPEPSVLLLDEPLTGLDHDLRDRLAEELGQVLQQASTTAVWVTHDAEEASRVAHRTVHLGDL